MTFFASIKRSRAATNDALHLFSRAIELDGNFAAAFGQASKITLAEMAALVSGEVGTEVRVMLRSARGLSRVRGSRASSARR
jgi:hypothetical protein